MVLRERLDDAVIDDPGAGTGALAMQNTSGSPLPASL